MCFLIKFCSGSRPMHNVTSATPCAKRESDFSHSMVGQSLACMHMLTMKCDDCCGVCIAASASLLAIVKLGSTPVMCFTIALHQPCS